MNKRVVLKGNLIRETNYKKILQLIGKGQQLTKLDIAYTLKISIPTVTTNINELKAEGIIEEVESDIYTGGRKPKIIRLIPNSRFSIGMNITKDRVLVMFMNLQNEILETLEEECELSTPIEYILKGKELIKQGIQKLNIDEENILGVGISIPGTINQKLGIIEQTNMGFNEISLDKLYDLFDTNVYIENEANFSLLAEKNMGEYDEIENLIYIGINEGLGGAIFVNGDLFTGTAGRAGEFGRMKFVEQTTGESYFVEEMISTRGLVEHYEKRTGKVIKTYNNFKELITQKDEMAIQILSEGMEALLRVIYNLSMILDIQTIIVGGKVGRLIKSQPRLLAQVMDKHKTMLERLDLHIDFSDVRHTSTIGAAFLPMIDFYKINAENE